MKTKFRYLLLILVTGIFTVIYFQNSKNLFSVENSKIEDLRNRHENYLTNSPFKETLELSKSERKANGIPPNKYFEREWELTMNPATGKPEPHKVFATQKNRASLSRRAPGDGDVTNDWVDRGPNNVGGRTRALLFDPNDTDFNRVFAGGVSGGLWVNEDITNENSSWVLVPGVPSNMNISSIAVDPNNSQIWYIGTGEQYTSLAPVGNGVYKSIDGGENWTHIEVQLAGGGDSGQDISGIFFITDIVAWNNPNGGGVGIPTTEIFMGIGTNDYYESSNPIDYLGPQNSGLYRSTDDGSNWSRIENSDLKLSASSSNYLIPNDFEISADNTLWMGSIRTPGTSNGGGKIFNSVDGENWNIKAILPESDRIELALSTTNEDKIYALTEGTGSDGVHIFVTTDAFLSDPVTKLGKPIDADNGISATDFTRGQAFYDLMIEVDPLDDDIVYVGGIDLFRTSEGESATDTDWKQISKWSNNDGMAPLNCALVHADQHALVFRPGNNNEAIIGNDGGVYYATDLSVSETNDVIKARNNNYNVTQFYSGSYGQDQANEMLLGGTQDNGSQFISSAISGVNPGFEIFGGDGAYNVIDKDGDYLIASFVYSNYFYYKLPYAGQYEYQISSDPSYTDGYFINPAELDHNLNILYSNQRTNKINRFVLGSSSAVKTTLSNVLLNGAPSAFKVSPFNTTSTTLFVGTVNSKVLKITNADEISGSISWEEITGPSFIGSVSDIEFGETENDIFVTFHNYGITSIWYSADGGVNWSDIEGDLPDIPVKCILPNPLNPNELIVGTELGIWSSSNINDPSPNWVSSNNGMRDVKVVNLDLRTSDNSILASTHGRGLFTGKFSDKDFTFSADEKMETYCGSGNAVFNIDFNTFPDYNTKTNFSTTGEPIGSTITFNPTSLENSDSFTLTIGNIESLAIGEYPISVIGTAGAETNEIEVVLKVVNPTTIDVVTTSSPLDETMDIDLVGIDFTWDENLEATSYQIEIALDPGFNDIIESEIVELNEYLNTQLLLPGTVYYWRVSAINNCVTSEFSEVKSFQTAHNCNLFSNYNQVTIPDGKGAELAGEAAESIINISNSFIVSDVNVSLNITHTYINDLVISVISPSGTEIILFNRECSGENDFNVIYDDEGSASITCGTPVSGVAIPTNLLNGFNTEDSLGDWTLKVVDFYNGDRGSIENWSIEVCENKTITNSTLDNNPILVAANSSYIIKEEDLKASSVGSVESEQQFMLSQLPELGSVELSGTPLFLGDVFTQEDINSGKVSYSNSNLVSTLDSFKVDVTNATGGFLPNQEVLITIDATLKVNDFFAKTGITVYPTISNGEFSIASAKSIENSLVKIYSMSGQLVYSQNLNFNLNKTNKIDAKNLSSGIYVLKMTADGSQGAKTIIIE